MWLWLLACTPTTDTASPTGSDTALTWDEEVEVVVIGAGPAGLAAGWAAAQAGAEVRIYEAQQSAGGAGPWIRYYWAAGTAYQELGELGDSPEQALADWEAATGGDGDDAAVAAFVSASAEVLTWLVDDLGGEVLDLTEDPATDELPRLHVLADGEDAPVHTLVDWMEPDTVLGTAVTAELGRVEQGWVLQTEAGTVLAQAVVVASGGFARDLERVLADRPSLTEVDTVLFDHAPHTDGAWGMPVSGDLQNAGALGLFVHGTSDPRAGYESETLVLNGLASAAVVTLEGARVADETTIGGLAFAENLLDAEPPRLFALWPEAASRGVSGFVAPYHPLDEDGTVQLSSAALLEAGTLVRHDSLEQLAESTGIDATGLGETLAGWDAIARGEAEDALGKDASYFAPFEQAPLVVTELHVSTSKAFTGLDTTLIGELLRDGEVLPGVFAAGEATGMLGSPGIGRGFAGSATAVYHSGLLAGQAAAESLAKK